MNLPCSPVLRPATDVIMCKTGPEGGPVSDRISKLLRGAAHRDVRLEETAHPVDRALLQLLRLLPREHRDLSVGRQRGEIDRSLQRMPWYVIRQHKHRRPAV